MIIGTFNGWSIVQRPAKPGIRQLDVTLTDSVGVTQSPFTMQTQTQQWPGADWWEFDVTLPPMARAQAQQWIAFLAELRGMANVFQMGDSYYQRPQGQPLGAPVVDNSVTGSNQAMTTVLSTRGWPAGAHNLLLPGDLFQIGYRLHMVVGSAVVADASGKAQINVWPSLRETPADGAALVMNKPLGLFRLADNARKYSVSETRVYGLSFKAVEAR